MIVEILDKSFKAVAWEKVDYRVPILINIDLLSLNILFFFFSVSAEILSSATINSAFSLRNELHTTVNKTFLWKYY